MVQTMILYVQKHTRRINAKMKNSNIYKYNKTGKKSGNVSGQISKKFAEKYRVKCL